MSPHAPEPKPSELQAAIVQTPPMLSPDANVLEAIAAMHGASSARHPIQSHSSPPATPFCPSPVSCVLVGEQEHVIGILTRQDIVRLLVEQCPLGETCLHQVMTQPVMVLQESTWTDELSILSFLQDHQIHHLPVVDDRNRCIGIITATTLLQALHRRHQSSVADAVPSRMTTVTRDLVKGENTALPVTPTITDEPLSHSHCTTLQTAADWETLVDQIALHIRNSLQVQEVLATCVAEVRAFLGCDRVLIYQFQPDWSGVVIAESVTSEWRSALSDRIQDACFQQQSTHLFYSDAPIPVHDVDTAGYTDCHLQLLKQYQVKANLVMPIRVNQHLWGLLIVHQCANSRTWQDQEMTLLQRISVQLAIAIQQATMHQQLQAELSDRQLAEQQLQSLIEGTSRTTGRDFFPALVNHIAITLQVSHVIVTEQLDSKLSSLAFWANQALQNNRLFDPATSPCGHTLKQGEFYCATGVQQQFPENLALADMGADSYVGVALRDTHGQPIGTLCILHTHPIRQPEQAQNLLRVFAARAAAELERVRTTQQLEALNQALEARVAERTAALQHSEERWQLALKGTNDGIWDWDLQHGKVFFSTRWKAMRGYAEDEVSDRFEEWLYGIHLDDYNRVTAGFEAHLTGKTEFFEIEYRVRHKDGFYIWILDRGQAIWDETGQVIRMTGSETDITARKQSETQLQHVTDRLTLALTAGAIGTWDWDIIQEVNWDQRMYEIYGLQDLDGTVEYQDWYDLIHPDDQEPTETALLAAIDGKQDFDVEFRIQPLNGTLRWIKATALVQRTAEGHPLRMVGINYDITGQKQIEERLRFSQERFESLVANVPGMVYRYFPHTADQPHHLTFVSSHAHDLLEVAPDTMIQDVNQLINLIHADDLPSFFASITHATEHLLSWQWEGRIMTPSGTLKWIQGNSQVQQTLEGYAWDGLLIDISDRKQAEQRIRQQVNQERLLREVSQRVRESLDLQTIFDTACYEIRNILQVDRVGIFKYSSDVIEENRFVAESVEPGWISVLSLCAYDPHFQEHYAALYTQGRFAVIDDVYNNDLSECHIEFLEQFQVRAKIVMPILWGDQLWGLLCVHQCQPPRQWEPFEIDLAQQLAHQLAIAIQQANLYEQLQVELQVRQQAQASIAVQLRRQKALDTITQQIRKSLQISEILKTATQLVKEVLQGDRVIVFQLFPDGTSQIVEEAVHSEFPSLKLRQWNDERWSQDILECYWQGQPRIVPDVMRDVWTNCLVEYSQEGKIQSKIVAPILLQDCSQISHRWVSPGEAKQLWGVLVVHACGERRVWQESDADLLQQIANQLAIAIQQANLFDQLQQELTERQQTQQQLTERNQQLALTNEELARATRLKDEFLANMSHELRTPLNSILGMTEGLQEHIFGRVNPEQLKALQTIEHSGVHLLELINDILDVAKIEAGQMELIAAPTSVSLLCQSSLAFIKQQALKKHIQLDIQIAPCLPDLVADERRLRQVLINLLNNAVKFTPEGGRVTLEVRCVLAGSDRLQGNQTDRKKALPLSLNPTSDAEGAPLPTQYSLQLAVIDTGIGIAPEHIDQLFQPFIQIDSALNRQYSGTGLGLALVKRIVDLHGGQVELTSEVGVGSRFAIHLPYVTTSSALPGDAMPLELQTHHANLFNQTNAARILLTDDHEANTMTLSSYLQARGYTVLLAKNGREAIAIVQSATPDLVLMDVQMPDMDGLEVIRQLRSHPGSADIPIIVVTALAMPCDRDRCLEAGATDYLSKPIKLKQLTSMIQQLLKV